MSESPQASTGRGASPEMSGSHAKLRTKAGKKTGKGKGKGKGAKVRQRSGELMRHPLALPVIALLAGLLIARILLGAIPLRGALELDLPIWLAELLSESGDQRLIIARPHALWLMPTAVAPFLMVMATRTLVDVRAFQVVIQVLLRLLVLMAIALALSQPSLQSPIRGKTVVFVVDVSESIDDQQLAGAQKLVREALELAAQEEAAGIEREDRTRVRLVTYAGRALVHDLSELEDENQLGDLTIDRDPDNALASDHASALRLAEALLDPDTEGRVVLLTDATGDLAEREGLGQAIFDL
ncbi:MAG: VWA domain-containing protein, partial [Myxococcales bacterium]|nr:VWA domain-containing protein [Myxococcales bacterium]